MARLRLRRVLTRDLLVLAALAGLAVTQPLLDLFGRNPEYFIAQEASPVDIVLFALVVTFLVPLVCLGVELLAFAIGDVVGRAAYVVLVALLATALGLSVAGHLGGGDALFLGVAVAFGAAVTVAALRVPVVQQLLRYLSAALFLFLATFLVFSRSGALIGSSEAAAAEGVRVGNPAPVVIIQLDELPLASLLDGSGELDGDRFPGFARLAEDASWFRNATAVSPTTTVSVPSALTGVMPTGAALPTSSDHPRNLFTLLGEDYQLTVDEQVTDLCPSALCGGRPGERVTTARATSTLRDASVVLGHLTLPPFLVDDLPAIDQSWGDFIDDGDSGDPATSTRAASAPSVSEAGAEGSAAPSAKWDALGPEGWAPRAQAGVVDTMIGAVEDTVEPTLWYSHAVFPHGPFRIAPSGLEFRSVGRTMPGIVDSRWEEDEWTVRQAYQLHLLQVGHADTLIGRLLDKMQAEGIWEEALVVVMADHGLAFEAGRSPREPTAATLHEIFNVPLFIKAPGDTQGETRDDNALLVDVLPSVVDLLDIDTDWGLDGRSLFGDTPEPDSKPVVAVTGPESVSVERAGVMRVVERNLRRVPPGGRAPVAAVGELGSLVGRPVADVDVVGPSDARWSVDQVEALADWRPDETGFIPLLWRGTIRFPGGRLPPDELLAVVNGRVAGVVGGFGVGDNTAGQFSAVIDGETLAAGANEVSLLVPLDRGRRFEQTGGPS